MRRKALRAACLAGAFVLAAFPALAMTGVESLAQQLSEQGFTEVRMSKTFLGRVRIRAKGPGIEREIIYNPVTGEILRDFWSTNSSGEGLTLLNPFDSSNSGSSNSGSSNSGSGSGSSDYDELDDALDDWEDARDDREDERDDRRDDREDRDDDREDREDRDRDRD